MTGLILDPRPAIEKLKDYDSREILASSGEVKWEEREPKFYSERNQSTSLSCMAQSGAKMLGINFNPFRDISAYGIYRERSNFPSGGMWNQDVGRILTEKFVSFNEKTLPSQYMGETQMNQQYIVTDEMKEQAKLNDAYKYIMIPTAYTASVNTFNEIVKVLASGYPVQLMLFFQDDTGKKNEYWKEFPEILNPKLKLSSGEDARHGVCATDYVLKNGIKYIVIEDSAGNHTTNKGQRYLSEEFVNKRCFGAMYITVFTNNVEQFQFTKIMRYGEQSEDIRKLQEHLQKLGLFPKNQIPTGYYGGITRKAVKDFQIKYGIIHNNGWQVGEKTLLKLNETMSKYPKALQSSVNPNNLALTVKGILISLIPLAIITAKYAGYVTDEATLMNIIEQITVIISVLVTVIGLVRKLIVTIKK